MKYILNISIYLSLHAMISMWSVFYTYTESWNIIYVSLHLRMQNAVPAQPCVGKLEISLVLLNFLHCNFR